MRRRWLAALLFSAGGCNLIAGVGDPLPEPTAAGEQDGTGVTFVEREGILVVEAEHFFDRDDKQIGQGWKVVSDLPAQGSPNHAAAASRGEYIEVLPDVHLQASDIGGFYLDPTKGPTVRYRARFTTAGTYYLWTRMFSDGATGSHDARDNTAYFSVDDAWPAPEVYVKVCKGRAWQWTSQGPRLIAGCGGRSKLSVAAPGEHFLSIAARDDGAEIDKWILTLDKGYVPVDLGPDETKAE